ncbi:GNAT family N-acetyltransferase [Glaciecola sp. MF2-115]|uniref:GNAT family N-acetyltransferase n=1 Tax=Glaciecola sp. MF2-115 TaxID=3384827 RepID=UPI0039A3CFFE
MDQNLIQVGSELTLKAAASSDFAAVASWFEPISSTAATHLIRQWAGPNVPKPCSAELLADYISSGNYHSYILQDESNILGFGQFQLVKHRVHLARLVIRSEFRGLGVAKRLLTELIEAAQTYTEVKEVSLFVYMENTKAIQCYETYGFAESPTPAGVNLLADCRFMTLRY